MFNFFSQRSPTIDSTTSTDNKNVALKPEAAAEGPATSPDQPATNSAAVDEVSLQQNASPATQTGPSEAQWYTCLDFVRVDGSQDTPTNPEDPQGDQKMNETESAQQVAVQDVVASPIATGSMDPKEVEGASMPVTKTDESDYNDSEWQEVTMTAFRGDSSPIAPVPKSDLSDSSSSGSDEDEEAPAPTAAPEVHSDVPTTGQDTILNIRAREQREKENQKRAELEALGKAAKEQHNLMAAKALAEAEEKHLRRAKDELDALAAEQAKAVAKALDEEEKLRRERAQQAAQASPVASVGSPGRRCDCLGASSGFHRQGCSLRV